MPQKNGASKSKQVPLRLSPKLLKLLDRLVAGEVLGSSRSEVLTYLLRREVERLFPDEVKGPAKE